MPLFDVMLTLALALTLFARGLNSELPAGTQYMPSSTLWRTSEYPY